MVSPLSAQPDNELVDWKPIAARLGLRERAFGRLVKEAGLPHYVINARVIRFRWSDVEAWLAERRKGGF
jgi:predicted DNA-binding transcriptional regulator AlpA